VVRGICERSTCVADGHVNLHLWCVAVDPETSRSPRQYGSGLVGRFVYRYYYSAPIGERIIVISVSVCLSVCLCVCLSAIISSELHVRSSPNFLCLLPMAVARSSSDGVMICYVLPVLQMTSYLLISQCCSTSPPS